ncbi:hypothetical protein DOTSEDRAFT_72524 [Dothistroma septosporum NZE10]|uniref:CDP-diacylglycerol--glycerol-3-phosphate 3-phosphatidyltransferase n=1 Tax=Dothistroma septosporum (strain NZE10 / CBS 128990) TaxID=675120 RepID=M2YME6_DOTSN|nr:hypothetical protein DOTSEDRAFT_72524 [Dothistroma septosporum NZE10]
MRRASTASSTSTTAATPSSQLGMITNELDKLSPRFDIPADSIQMLRSPNDFYESLKTKIKTAKHRIYFSTLYIGSKEHELIDTIRQALRANPELKVSLLTDYLRGSREAPQPSCASLLATLVEDFGPERVDVRLYHTPNLTGTRKSIIPKRINEGWGLQHMKLYGIDDEIIMSGANLSNDYFTNRQDRYHVFKSKAISDWFGNLYGSVTNLSYRVLPSDKEEAGFTTLWPETNVQPAPLEDPERFIEAATDTLKQYTELPPLSAAPSNGGTQVYPLVQLTPLLRPDTSTELPALTGILRKLGTPDFAGSRWTFTAGYFNMTPEVRQLLLRSNPSSATVVAASPWANGFYGSKGVSGMLPAAYTYLARCFLDAVAREGLSERISVKEWRNGTVNEPGGWTYHAKGIWVTLPGQENPCISLIGSSNYTKRSYSLDLEANTLIVTKDPDLQRRLGEEEKWLQEYATSMTRDDYAKAERRVGLHVRLAMWIVRLVGGAL